MECSARIDQTSTKEILFRNRVLNLVAHDRAAFGIETLARTTASGQSRHFGDVRVTSALPLKTDIYRKGRHVSKVPNSEVTVIGFMAVRQR
jgi:hypothetical protein